MSLRITAAALPVSVALLASCGTSHTPTRSTHFRLPQGLATAPPGKFAVVAEVPNPGTAAPDKRNYLAQPADLLPGPDGGIVAVSESAPSIFTWITRSGELKPYIASPFPAYTGPSGAVSAYQDSPRSAIIITDTGEIARVSGNNATHIAQLPAKGNADILAALNTSLLIQQENNTYRLELKGSAAALRKVTIPGVPNSYSLGAISRDGSIQFATNGRTVIAVDSGRIAWRANIEEDGVITSVISDGASGAWVGDNKGGLFHAQPGGRVIPISAPGGFARSCLSGPGIPPIGEVYSMLLLKDQLYIADKRCDRITSFGVPNP
jgi:hypothetical protein